MNIEAVRPPLDQDLSLGQKCGRAAVAFGITINGIASIASTYYEGDPLYVQRSVLSISHNQGADPVPEDIQDVIVSLADARTSQRYINFNSQTLQVVDDGPMSYEQRVFFAATPEAIRFGLHLVDPTETLQLVDTAQTVEEVFKALEAYGGSLGLPIVQHYDSDLRDIGMGVTPLSHDSMFSLAGMKQGTHNLIASMSLVPKELYGFADIKEMRIVNSIDRMNADSGGDYQPSAKTNPVTGILYAPLRFMMGDSKETFIHELWHAVDYHMNGDSLVGAFRDKEYTDLNQPGFDYDGDAVASERNTVNSYGASNPIEDKATLMETVLTGADVMYLDSEHPVISSKYVLMLGRCEEYIPGLGQYWLTIAPHEKRFGE